MSSDTTASTDKFLFLFKPQVDDKCVFGISLKIAVRIVSVFLILVSLSEFFEAFSQNKLWVLLWNIFFAIFFLINLSHLPDLTDGPLKSNVLVKLPQLYNAYHSAQYKEIQIRRKSKIHSNNSLFSLLTY